MKQVEEYKLCSGVPTFELTSKLFHQVIPINKDSLENGDQNQPFPNKRIWRTVGCLLICEEGESACVPCTEYITYVNNTKRAKEKCFLKPAHIKTPVSKTNQEG